MSTYFLWMILAVALGNPILAGALVIVGIFLVDRVAVNVLPDPLRWLRRWSRTNRLRRTLLNNPSDRRARFELAEQHVSRKRFQQAVDTLKPNLEAGDDDPHTLFVMGLACLGAGHHQQGETFLDAAEAQDPNFRLGDIDLERGRFRLARKDYPGAIEALRRFKGRRQASIEGLYLLSRALEQSGDDASAALEREQAWREYVAAPGFQRKRERRWAWSSKPSRPLLYASLLLLGLLLLFRVGYPAVKSLARQDHGYPDIEADPGAPGP